LFGILKCPCYGKGMYGNIAKAGRKDNRIRYYYIWYIMRGSTR